MTTKITAIKAFDADLRCRGFQYEVGETYRHEGAVIACSGGFHACENPFDVWSYYPVVDSDGRLARYAEVELGGATDRRDDKIAAAEITIKAELKLPDFVKRAVASIIAATKGKDEVGNRAQIGSSGYDAQIGSSGNRAQIGSSGEGAQIGSSGYGAQIGSSGYDAQIGSSGNRAQIGSSGEGAQIGSSGEGAQIGSSGYDARIGSSGYGARIGSSGNRAQIGSSGYDARIGSSGYHARIGSSGEGARIVCEGDCAVVASAGRAATVSGKAGTWVSLACYDADGYCIGFATGCIGQDGLKPDTPYRAENCKFVEVKK